MSALAHLSSQLRWKQLQRTARNPAIRKIVTSVFSLSSSRILTLAMAIAVARALGPEGYGNFAFATGLAMLAGQLGGLGWPMLITRMIPKYVHEGDWGRLRGILRSTDAVTLVAMAVIGLAFVGFALLFLDATNPLQTGLFVAAALMVPTGFRLQHRQQAAALGYPATGIFLDEAVTPIFIMIGCLVLMLTSENAIYATFVVGTFVSAMVTRVLCRRWTDPATYRTAPVYEFGNWMHIAIPMITAVATRVVLNRIDAVMIAPLSSTYEVGLYNTAFRVTFLASTLPAMTNGVIRPMLARLNEAGEYRKVAEIMRYYYAFTAVVAFGISAIMFVFAEPILRIAFGAEFVVAAALMQVLAVSQFMGSLAEASSSYLLMCGKERAFGLFSLVGLILTVIANFFLIPRMGAMGAAIASTMTNALFLVVSVTLVARTVRARIAES